MRNEDFNNLSIAYSFKKIALNLVTDVRGFLITPDRDWLVESLDFIGVRCDNPANGSCDQTISWRMPDGSYFYLENPEQQVYPCAFSATDKEVF